MQDCSRRIGLMCDGAKKIGDGLARPRGPELRLSEGPMSRSDPRCLQGSHRRHLLNTGGIGNPSFGKRLEMPLSLCD
jgi:hypothetical protein